MKSLSNLFYRLPRLTSLAIVFILMTGVSSFINLPRQEDPTMTERYAQLEAFMPGASAVRVEALVTEKLENALREVPEVRQIKSTTRAGYCNIQVELYDFVGKDTVDLVWSEVRDKLSDIETTLPQGASKPVLKVQGPVAVTLGVAITSEGTPLSVLERIATELQTRIASLPGTKETKIYGEPKQEILVEVNPQALARTNLTMPQLIQLIGQSDTKVAAGEFNSQTNSLVVEVKGELTSVERIGSIPLPGSANGNFLRLSDIASIKKHYIDPPDSLAILHDQRGILVTTTMETGRRVDKWIAGAKSIVENYRSELPEMVELTEIIDQNYYTNERLSSLVMNLLMAIALVLISLLFLMGLRSALIIGAALPLTMGMVLTGLVMLEIPLHQMSVTGLIIALGLLIDNAIVVVEEYKIQRSRGYSSGDAIAHGINHLFVPLLASTATTAFAFLPIAMTPGGVGDFTGSMAVAVVLSVSASFLLAMTVIPTVAGYVDDRLPQNFSNSKSWLVRGIAPAHLTQWYRRSIELIFRKPLLGIGLSLILPICGFLVAGTMTSSFFPPVDRNQFQVQITLPANASVQTTVATVEKARAMFKDIPEIIDSHWFIGEQAPRVYYNMIGNNEGVASFANGFATTAHVDDPRKILPDLQKRLMNEFPEARIMALPFEQGPPFSAPIEIRIVGPELNTLKNIGEQIRLILSQTTDVTYTTATLSASVPQVSVYPNENMNHVLGLNNQDIPAQLNSDLSGLKASTVMEGSTEIPVRVRYSVGARNSLSELTSLPIMGGMMDMSGSGSTGSQTVGMARGYNGIPLEQLADIQLEPSPNRIDRHQNERINTISGFLLPYAFPSVAVEDFRRRMEEQHITLPPGYRIEFGGEEEERGEAVNNIIATFLTFLWLMVAVIVLSLNSFRHAGIIGLVGFLSVGLALFGVWLSGYPLGYTALIGTLGLIGLAINGAIIVLSALKANPAANEGDMAAGIDVVMESSRHIVSTTITTIGGFLPLILFGGHFWPPLAMAIAGGVTGSAVLALYLVPAMFSYYSQRAQKKQISELVPDNASPTLGS